jgi:hypothetical protein
MDAVSHQALAEIDSVLALPHDERKSGLPAQMPLSIAVLNRDWYAFATRGLEPRA